jgi:hypothetical protein
MAVSEVSICNMALGWCGVGRVIAALDEVSPEARLCRQYYGPAREQTLRDFSWNFATKRVSLAEKTVPDEYDEYAYAYGYPVDCLRALKLRAAGLEYDFEVVLAADGASRLILADVEEAVLVYTSNVSIPALFDPLFVKALARRLAADMGPTIFKSNAQKIQELETLYKNEILRAQAADAKEGKPDEVEEIPWIVARTMPEGV